MICRSLAILLSIGVPIGHAAAVASPGQDKTPLPLPQVRLVPMAGFEDEADYVSAVEQRVKDLLAEADTTASATARVELRLAAANVLIAQRLEPACSLQLNGIEGPGAPPPGELRAVCARINDLLSRAETDIASLSDGDDLPEGWVSRVGGKRNTLAVLSDALRVVLIPPAGDEGLAESRRVGSALSRVLEYPEPAMVEAAILWQAYLRSRQGDPGRVMALLPRALAEPSAERMPYAFYTRLFRCRLLGQQGWYATSLATLMQLEERCIVWFDQESQQKAALRTVEFARLRTLADWHQSLGGDPARAEQRRWCVEQMASLIDEAFSEGDKTLLRLSATVPTIATPPDRGAPTTADPEGS